MGNNEYMNSDCVNRSKANEIALMYANAGVDVVEGKPTRNMLYHCALEIAEWKDKEFEKRVVFALGCDTCAEHTCYDCVHGNIRKKLLNNDSEQ